MRKSREDISREYDVEIFPNGDEDFLGWAVLYSKPGDDTEDTLSRLFSAIDDCPVVKFNTKRWLNEFKLTWCYRKGGYVVLVDENCPELYKLDYACIQEVVELIISKPDFEEYTTLTDSDSKTENSYYRTPGYITYTPTTAVDWHETIATIPTSLPLKFDWWDADTIQGIDNSGKNVKP